MTLRRAIIASSVFLVAISAVLFFSLYSVWNNAHEMDEAQMRRQESLILAEELRQSSEDLTGNIRAYAVTGDDAYSDAYWDVVKIRGGEKERPAGRAIAPGERRPLLELMERAGFTPEELDLLREAGKRSDSLIALETEAMHAVQGKFRDASGAYTVAGEPNRPLATGLVFGKEYRDSVTHIMQPIDAFQQRLNKRLDGALREKAEGFQTALTVLIALLAVVLAAMAVFMLLLNSKVIRPIIKCDDFAMLVAKGNLDSALDHSGSNEIGSLAVSLRSMVAALRERIGAAEEATAKAEENSLRAENAVREAETAKSAAERARSEGMRQAGEQLQQIVERAQKTSDSLSRHIRNAVDGAESQQRRLTEASQAMDQLNQVVMEVARNTASTTESAEDARRNAVAGSEIVNKVITSISEVDAKAASLRTELGHLGERAEGIGRVMGVISDIADQTNLLALNAAIEAARAGEAGRGFAVVADEVRKLAEKTMLATREVGEAVAAIQNGAVESIRGMEETSRAVAAGTDLATSAGDSLLQIVGIVQGTAEKIHSIAVAAEEQSSTCEEITRTTESIHKTAGDTLVTMEDSSRAVAEINEVVKRVSALTETLRTA